MGSPFVQGLIQGKLAREQLEYRVRVDYPYLVNFSRILAEEVSQAPNFEAMSLVSSYLEYIRSDEMASHEALAMRCGISRDELESQVIGPVKYAYLQHEYLSASKGDLADILAVLTPYMYGCQILWKRILKKHVIEDSNPYLSGFETYGADDALDGHVTSLLGLLNDLAEKATPERREPLRAHFLRSEYFETIAWDAYFNIVSWPKI